MMTDTEQRFQQFHRDNPHVFRRLAALCHGLVRRGCRRYSIRGLIEVVRYEHALRTTGTTTEAGERVKLCNSFTPFYARLLMDTYPELGGLFQLRSSMADHAECQSVQAPG